MNSNRTRLQPSIDSPVQNIHPTPAQRKSLQTAEAGNIESVTVKAPCTTANLGPGFDVFALALDAFYDTIQIQTLPRGGVELEIAGLDSDNVPADANLNSAGLVAKHLLSQHGIDIGVKIRVVKGVPVAKGLGSSAASAAATAVGLNSMLGLQLTENQIVESAAQGEIASAGVAHADNVAAAVLGGFTFVRSYSPLSVIGFDPPRRLEIAIAIPQILAARNKTEHARAVLPEGVSLRKVAHNVGGAASIVAGILSEDIDLIGKGMVDAIVEPARAQLVPNYAQVKKAALKAGAEGVAISGAGPSMIAIVDNAKVRAASVSVAMGEAFESAGVRCWTLASKTTRGATVLKE